MKWPKRPPNGEAAQHAIEEAKRQHRQAQATAANVDAVAMAADMLTRRSDRFVREVEQALRRRV